MQKNFNGDIRRRQSRAHAQATHRDWHAAHIDGHSAKDSADERWAERNKQRAAEENSKAKTTDWTSHVFTAAALRTMDFSPVSYAVNNLIPEGLTILAGRPKIGKSWMALELAIGIADHRHVLGEIEVDQGDVLYCALEDNPRRLQRRVTKILSPFSGEWPDRLTLATQWRRLDKGGVEDIKAWCDSVQEPRLILLDTLAGVRPPRNGPDTLYDSDYKALRDVRRS